MSRPARPTSSSPSDCSGGDFDWDVALRKLDELNARAEVPTLWDKPAEAQALMRERDRLAGQVEAVSSLERDLADAVEFAEMADAEGDEDSLSDAILDRPIAFVSLAIGLGFLIGVTWRR